MLCKKIIAGYHQFHAVNAAVDETVRASGMAEAGMAKDPSGTYWAGRMHGGRLGDRRAGVVWHTQGSGKSFSMLFYAARVVRHPAMQNPTLVVLTDRNDLDDQLFGQFQRCADILGQPPVQAASREDLRELLNRASGGVVFTTIHKFAAEKGEAMPELSARQNIVVIADEAPAASMALAARRIIGPARYPTALPAICALPCSMVVHRLHQNAHRKDGRRRGVSPCLLTSRTGWLGKGGIIRSSPLLQNPCFFRCHSKCFGSGRRRASLWKCSGFL